ncbi:MAG: adenylate/guanylate cyclase domain-containing protein [Crocinitomicaceae bacterium]|nr:adenylate/guanylate cyclase domain-containing protein [Crocinitomicaceae bacterium]
MFKRIIYITFFLLGISGYAQNDYRFRNYTINNGLSQSSATTIVQDDLNTLWVGTQDGLNRYDGKSFETFTSDKIDGLESDYIVCSHKDYQGNLWFGTSKGLTKYNIFTEQFKTYATTNNEVIYVEDITEDEDGNIWIATAESGVFKYNSKTNSLHFFSSFTPSKKTTNIEFTSNTSFVVSTADRGVYVYDLIEKKSYITHVERTTIVNKIKKKGANNVLLATNQGFFELNSDTKKTNLFFEKHKKSFKNVSDVYFEEEVGWLVCTKNKGLFVIKENGEIFQNTEDIFQKTALLFNETNCIYKDVQGTFWIGSQRGLSSFNPLSKGIRGIGPSGDISKGIPTASVWSFEETKDAVFIGTDNAISRLDKQNKRFTQYKREDEQPLGLSGEKTVLSIKAITNNHLLVGCADGLFDLKIHGNTHTFKKIKTNGFNRTYAIVHWKKNMYWVASKKGALLYDIKTKKITSFIHDPKMPKTTMSKGICRLVYKDKNNHVWFATSTGGVNKLHENQNGVYIAPYQENKQIKEFSTEQITSINNTNPNIYWLGTFGSGLLRWDAKQKKGTLFNKSNGLPNDVIYGVILGEDKNLWLSTNKGVCCFNPETKATKNYTESDGLMSNEFNLGAHFKTNEDVVYFGGIYGYNYFKTEDLTPRKTETKVVFYKLKLDGGWLKPNKKGSPLVKPMHLTRELNLPYEQRSFTVSFLSSDLSNPTKTRYKYMLEGSSEEEIELGTSNEIHFNALAHGSYILKVYAKSADGTWGVNPGVLKITIEAPLWRRGWFLVLCIAFFSLLVRVFIRKRIDLSRREQVRLEMKIRDRTKEIKAQTKRIERQKEKIEEERNNVILQQELLQKEKDKTERLLKNVLPTSTAEELKKRGKARARAYKTVSVLFTDFVGFTKISDRTPATELVKKLDVYFSKFDEIIIKNNLEKIKTIGDAYMCAGGVPVRNKTNPIDACLAAIQIQAYMLKRKNDAIANEREYWGLRLGINTGDVIAGVIGSERLAFDVWGATVNHAQRMEMLGEAEKVTITGSTFMLIEPYFECTFKGRAQTKSRGFIDMYVVDRIKKELSVKGEGVFPNEKFKEIVNLHLYSPINYYKAERHIMKVLEKGLSKTLYYHSVAHTKDVVSAVEHLALAENVTDEGLFLLKSAATYHDAGFVEKYVDNEDVGARLADEILPKYGYTTKHIEKIKMLIFATKIPHSPKDKLEEIICDADLDYLGRKDFHQISNKLRDELIEHGKVETHKQWDEIQVSFLKKHKYFTKTAKKIRNKIKAQNLQEVLNRLQNNDYKQEANH